MDGVTVKIGLRAGIVTVVYFIFFFLPCVRQTHSRAAAAVDLASAACFATQEEPQKRFTG